DEGGDLLDGHWRRVCATDGSVHLQPHPLGSPLGPRRRSGRLDWLVASEATPTSGSGDGRRDARLISRRKRPLSSALPVWAAPVERGRQRLAARDELNETAMCRRGKDWAKRLGGGECHGATP